MLGKYILHSLNIVICSLLLPTIFATKKVTSKVLRGDIPFLYLRTVNKIAVLFLVLMMVFSAFHYGELPAEIPIHYNAAGVADGYGEKQDVWALPVIAIVLFVGLLTLEKKTKIPLEKKVIKGLNVAIVLTFSYLQLKTLSVALHRSEGLGKWFLPVFIFVMTIVPLLPILKEKFRPKKETPKP